MIKAWPYTTDAVYEALVSYPRAVVRRKMVPGGAQWGEPYDFTAEQLERLRDVIVPRLLNDRAKKVRERTRRVQDFTEWLEADDGRRADDYPYPSRWGDDTETSLEYYERPWVPVRTSLD